MDPLDPPCADPDLPSPETVVPLGAGSLYFLASGENDIGEGVLDSTDLVRGLPPTPCP